MKRFNDLKIGTRILTGFFVVVVIAGMIGGIGIFSLQRVNGSYKVSYTDNTAALQYSEKISSSFQRIRMNLYGYVLAETPQDKDYYLVRMNDLQQTVHENITAYLDMFNGYDPQYVQYELGLLDALQSGLSAFDEKRNELIQGPGKDPKRRVEAFEWLKDGGEIRTIAMAIDTTISELVNCNIEYAATQITNNSSLALTSTIIIIICVGAGITLAVIIGLYISRGISKKIALLVEASDRLAIGDINVRVEADSKDEIGHLMESFAKMIANTREQAMVAEKIAAGDLTVAVAIKSEHDLLGQKLHELVEQNSEVLVNIATASDQVSAGSEQVAAGSQALSQGATEQASSVEELTATIVEVSGDLKNSANNARQAQQFSKEAEQEVVGSNRQMQRLKAAMEDITQTSQEIGKIIKTIDDIAFQTNILALNAAVEAARAGAAGQGFAVVADEVRNLAGKSAEAAKSTAELIDSTLSAIKDGRNLTDETARSLNQVVEKSKMVDEKVLQIADDVERESHAVEQIAVGIDQISAVVQTNSATAEESAAASEELAGQATLLKEQISKFKLKKETSQSFYPHLEYSEHDSVGGKDTRAHDQTANPASDKIALGGKY